ncbi:MAG: hypothetical protein JO088_21480 [Acidobacteria bacterium]|nr:hypothetical protein [Acidobacteriota bacterium]
MLDKFVNEHELERDEQQVCGACKFDLSGTGATTKCPNPDCGVAFHDRTPLTILRYTRLGNRPRLIPWFLVVHGMNTRGEWQESLAWQIGRTYGRMVPVSIYKYGKIRPGILFVTRQRQLMRQLTKKMKTLSQQSESAGLYGRPDVIAHSFGTWLVANALLNDKSLIIGRLILLGAVVQPDFPWQDLVRRGQVEYILNHEATCDRWVPLACYAIPTSGPGGTRGFPLPVSNIQTPGLGHSDYFNPESRMIDLFTNVWRPFLSWTEPQFSLELVSSQEWKRPWWITRKVTWLLAFVIIVFVMMLSLTVLGLGFFELWRLIEQMA